MLSSEREAAIRLERISKINPVFAEKFRALMAYVTDLEKKLELATRERDAALHEISQLRVVEADNIDLKKRISDAEASYVQTAWSSGQL